MRQRHQREVNLHYYREREPRFRRELENLSTKIDRINRITNDVRMANKALFADLRRGQHLHNFFAGLIITQNRQHLEEVHCLKKAVDDLELALSDSITSMDDYARTGKIPSL